MTSETQQETGRLEAAISAARKFFFQHQHPDGFWVAELEGDALLQGEMILLLTYLGEEDGELGRELAQHLLDTQFDDGGWGQFTHGPSEICNTVKAYFALKILGHDPEADYMVRARNCALALGGAEKVNSFTRFYLALLGQIPYECCPAVPPQMMFIPNWFPVNIYDMSAWSRTIFVPLSIVSALQPVRKLPPTKGISELFATPPEKWGPLVAPGKKYTKNPFSWDFFFRCCNRSMWFCRKIGLTPLRKASIKKALDWTLERFERSDGPGAIQPPIVWSWIALKTLGYADDSKEVQYCRKQLMDLVLRNEAKKSARVQPCKSPVWDTALTLKSLLIGGVPTTNPAIEKGLRWIRTQQIDHKGDWSKTNPVEPGAWCFEFNNEFYPDCDDTAMALMVLGGRFSEANSSDSSQQEPQQVRNATQHRREPNAVPDVERIVSERYSDLDETRRRIVGENDLLRGLRWELSMQCRDGGWAAFDRDNNKEILCTVPFADHNAMIDPSTPDLTGRVMEALGRLGFRVSGSIDADGSSKGHPAIDRVVEFMRRQQKSNGSWFGRWGVNYIYGTWQALTGLTAVGVPTSDPAIQAGADWLLRYQQDEGGWGETPGSYGDENLHGKGNATASQTAWAVMGLLAAGRVDDPAVERGVQFLINRQRDNGTWYEPEYTGTGFPLVFYLRYHYYSMYFPLMALSLYAALSKKVDLQNCAMEPGDAPKLFDPCTAFYNNGNVI